MCAARSNKASPNVITRRPNSALCNFCLFHARLATRDALTVVDMFGIEADKIQNKFMYKRKILKYDP